MAWDDRRHIVACTVCARGKSLDQAPTGILYPLELPHRPWSHIAVDFVVGLPESHGNTVIMTIIDRFSKMAQFISIANLSSAAEMGELLVQHVFYLYRLPGTSCPIGVRSSPRRCGGASAQSWAPPPALRRGIIPSRTGRLNGRTKAWRAPSGV